MSDSQSPYTPPPVFDPMAGTPPRPRRSLPMILGIAGLVLLLPCVCCTGISFLIGRNIYIAASERDNIQWVVHLYMLHMQQKQVAQAYTLFSARAQRQVPMSKLQETIGGPGYVLYEGYQQTAVTFVNVSSSAHSDQNQPQGTVANVSGMVWYAKGVQGTFQAVLEREDGQWRLHRINISVPPSKINASGAK